MSGGQKDPPFCPIRIEIRHPYKGCHLNSDLGRQVTVHMLPPGVAWGTRPHATPCLFIDVFLFIYIFIHIYIIILRF